jgi:hypothetical protein
MTTLKPGISALALTIALALANPSCSRAQSASQAGALLHDDFETSTGDWVTMGPDTVLTVAPAGDLGHAGHRALQYGYTVPRKTGDIAPAFGVLLRKIPEAALTGMRSIDVWMRSDDAMPLAFTLQEKDAGRYVTFVNLPAGAWRHVQLQPQDFWLADGPNDPRDPDGKLDLDQVEVIGMVSIWSFLATTAPANDPIVSAHCGPHKLWLSEFVAGKEPLSAPPAPSGGAWIDDLSRDPLLWLPWGQMDVSLEADSPLKSRAIRLQYLQAAKKLVGISHNMRGLHIKAGQSISFKTASDQLAHLVVAIEKKNGARYNSIVTVAQGSAPEANTVSVDSFTLADDSPPDPEAGVTNGELKTFTIADLTGFLAEGERKNTLWIGPIDIR